MRLGPKGSTQTKKVGGNCPNILEVCCRGGGGGGYVPQPVPYTAQCGAPLDPNNFPDIDIRITLNQTLHGFNNVAQFGKYPWMAAVLQSRGQDNLYVSGGSLIHPQVVLTVAHHIYQ